jgi:hypothetical protein
MANQIECVQQRAAITEIEDAVRGPICGHIIARSGKRWLPAVAVTRASLRKVLKMVLAKEKNRAYSPRRLRSL